MKKEKILQKPDAADLNPLKWDGNEDDQGKIKIRQVMTSLSRKSELKHRINFIFKMKHTGNIRKNASLH